MEQTKYTIKVNGCATNGFINKNRTNITKVLEEAIVIKTEKRANDIKEEINSDIQEKVRRLKRMMVKRQDIAKYIRSVEKENYITFLCIVEAASGLYNGNTLLSTEPI